MFVERDGGNNIIRVWTVRQFPGQEEIADNHADLDTFYLPIKKSEKCAAVDALYSGQYGTCTHLTFTWHANDLSAGKIEAKHNHYKAAPPATITWADTSGTLRTLSWADFESLKNRIFEFHEATFAKMKTLKTAINALGTVAAVEAYDITTGWPA